MQVSREERWEEVRNMFKTHTIILDLMEIDPFAVTDEQFRAYLLLDGGERVESKEIAEVKRSFAFEFFRLIRTFYQLQQQKKKMYRQANIKEMRRQLRKWTRKTKMLERMNNSEGFFVAK